MGWNELWDLAAKQHGVVHLRQADGCGVPRSTLEGRARREGLHRPQPAVVAAPGRAPDLRGQAMAISLAVGDRGLVSGRAGLWLHGVGREPAWIDVVVPVDRLPTLSRPARVRRSRTLMAGDATRVDGIGLATVERCLFDLAAWEGGEAVEGPALEAIQSRRTTPELLRRRADWRLPLRGRGRVLHLADLAQQGVDSVFERKVRDFVEELGLPRPASQVPVRAGGRVLHHDLGWPDRRVAIECVGLGAHGKEQLSRDMRRLNALRGSTWEVVWVDWDRWVNDPDGLAVEILEAYHAPATTRL